LTERDQAAQATELQAARQQNAALTEQLAEQTRQTQQWQETAQQKLAEVEQLTARHQDAEQAAAASHRQETEQLRQETDQLRQEIAKLASQNALTEGQQEAQATELQTARKQSAEIAEQVAEQTRQTQHWQQVAGQAQTEIERLAARQQEAEQTAANYRQEVEQLRQQVSELIDQQTLAERVPPAELQAALEQNAAMSEQLAVQTRQSQHWQETAQRQLAEIEGSAEQRQEVVQFRRQIAELIDEQALVKRAQAAQAAELQTARQQNAAMAEELGEQRLQTQHWQEMASCAKQVTELRAMLERQQASQDTQTRKAVDAAIANASHPVDLDRRVDGREDSSMPQSAHSGSLARQTPAGDPSCKPPAEGTPAAKSPEQLAEQKRRTAQSQAQWEQLLRNRSKPQK
jgi:DNA repair exonuclease SbcCD ATPase subunit